MHVVIERALEVVANGLLETIIYEMLLKGRIPAWCQRKNAIKRNDVKVWKKKAIIPWVAFCRQLVSDEVSLRLSAIRQKALVEALDQLKQRWVADQFPMLHP